MLPESFHLSSEAGSVLQAAEKPCLGAYAAGAMPTVRKIGPFALRPTVPGEVEGVCGCNPKKREPRKDSKRKKENPAHTLEAGAACGSKL